MNSPKFSTTFMDGSRITPFSACGVIEGFYQPSDPDPESDELNAWSYLIGTGIVWTLQGAYGRMAEMLINSAVLDINGTILTTTLN